MILRLIVENIASFKNAVEFNTFPSSKSQSHCNHKVKCGHATALRLGAIYGANGAGKSNLLAALALLKQMIVQESLQKVAIGENISFKFDNTCINAPSGIAIEYYHNKNIYYYHVEFDRERVYLEELYISKASKDELVFKRDEESFQISKPHFLNGYNEQFAEGLQRLVRSDMMALPFVGKLYAQEFPIIASAYSWFTEKLQVVAPDATTGFIPHFLDTDKEFETLVNSTIQEMNTGISQLKVNKELIEEEKIIPGSMLYAAVNAAKQYPGVPQPLFGNRSGEVSNIIYDQGQIVLKTLVAIHADNNGDVTEMPITRESDGTRRIIEYMPLLYAITRQNAVYIVDEIERSIHPILIKEIVKKLSKGDGAKGQLIFTTHESALLDQDIFRPDEIWFAQKDTDQATQLYPLSDFNIHKTANIENGYLNGRYGGIPFLSNLKDLHW